MSQDTTMQSSMESTGQSQWFVEYGTNLDSGGFVRKFYNVEDKIDFQERYGEYNTYRSAWMYDSQNVNEANIIGDVYLDFDAEIDGEDTFNKIRGDVLMCLSAFKIWYGVPTEMIHIYFSGCKGVHIMIPYQVFEIAPRPDLHLWYKHLAIRLHAHCKNKTLDLKIYDKRRLFRIPNSRHRKTGLYKIPLTHNEIKTLSYTQILALAKEPRTVSYMTPRTIKLAALGFKQLGQHQKQLTRSGPVDFSRFKGKEFWPPCIHYLLDNKTIAGSRNNVGCVIAAYMHHHGYTVEETRAILEKWGQEMCIPHLSKDELETILGSMHKGGYNYGCATIKVLNPDACNAKQCGMKRK